MEDPTTIAMNLTFFGTLGVALVMFFGLFLALVITLLLAGIGRLLAVAVAALARALKSAREPAGQRIAVGPNAVAAGTAKASRPAKPAKLARKEPQLSPEWAAAVERADARARARAKAEAAPEIAVSVRDQPAGPVQRQVTGRNTERKAS